LSVFEAVKKALPQPLRELLWTARLKARGASLLLGPRVVSCRVRGRSIRLRVSTPLEHYRAETYASKEPETLDWLERELGDSDVLYDVGANIGLYALYSAALRPSSRVYAFEAEAPNLAQLCRNVHLNAFANVVPLGVALSDRDRCDTLCVSAVGAGEAFHGLGRPSDQRLGGPATAFRQGVAALTIDSLVDRLGLPPPTLLKLDVDGFEAEVLRGAAAALRGGSLRGVLMEVNAPGTGGGDPAAALLSEAGFREAGRGPAVRMARGEGYNCVFRR